MRSFNLTLSPVEADACGAEYWDEKSFRGEYARALSRIVALIARMSTELEALRQKQNSAHLWKPHASSMRFLLDASSNAFDQAGQRGLNEKINAMKESLQKLRTRVEAAEQMLKELEIRNQE
jgi:Skp family chaperone for outer membrane proteins